MALSPIADNEMATITGQAGVSIGADLTTNLTAQTIAWGDADGIGGATTAGWVGLSTLAIDNMRMHMRSDAGMADAAVGFGYYSTLFGGTYAQFVADAASSTPSVAFQKSMLLSILATNQFLTIDVYTSGAASAVRIGIPTFEISMASMEAKAGLWSTVTNDATFQELGSIYVKNMVALLGKDNYVDISKNETTSGIKIVMGNLTGKNLIDVMTIEALSWGDNDGTGVAAGSLAGFVGLTNLTVTGVKASAIMSINVATGGGAGVPALLAMDQAQLLAYEAALPTLLASGDAATKNLIGYMLTGAGVVGTTAVDIALSGTVSIASITATAALGSTKDLAGAVAAKNVLGSLYVKNLVATIPVYGAGYAASWVSIAAH